uniref:Putative LAGLIDADG homing endonuclease n=1 Tax=Coleochaete scutata TaxID=3125 RepID=A0A5P9NW22_COLSC|nr:putative LAGLIDADG homing endonuclease [Coleochaete scutata]QFU80168.1 putative LAGLIDADG homing endonuclease [Coleochaete scutata]
MLLSCLTSKDKRFSTIASNGTLLPRFIQLPPNLLHPMVGDMLGGGYLRFPVKDKEGHPSGNARFEFTQGVKNKNYFFYLWNTVYSEICTKAQPTPYPSLRTGKPIQQYWAASRFEELISFEGPKDLSRSDKVFTCFYRFSCFMVCQC